MAKTKLTETNSFWVLWVIIFVVLVLIQGAEIDSTDNEGNYTAAQAQIRNFKTASVSYKSQFKRYPDSLEKLVSNESGIRYLEGDRIPNDPWGNPYVYWSDGARCKIVSYGADGREGGEEFNADIDSDRIALRE